MTQEEIESGKSTGRPALVDLEDRLREAMLRPMESLAQPSSESQALHAALDEFNAQVHRLKSAVRLLNPKQSDESAD